MAAESTFGGPFRPRLKQDEKSAETRRRLLDAALECLVERGYANVTSSEVAERAGLSRGAQLYHFPTKEELLTRAVERLFDLLFAELRESVAGIRELEDRRSAAIDLLWKIAQGPLYRAWVELALASRTDHYLRDSVRAVNNRFIDYIDKTFPEIFGVSDGADELRMFPHVVVFVLEGLALEGDALDEAMAARTIAAVKYLINQTAPPRGSSRS
jgi:AcrR family transcriptional regulator